jgi:hypothetical protein
MRRPLPLGQGPVSWLPTLTIDFTTSAAPWWQTFPVYKSHDNRRVVFQWERALDEPGRICISPLQEARRYVRILESDPSVKSRADLAREMGVSKARITQIMNLLLLDSEIWERLLGLEDQTAIRFFSERRLRPLIQIGDPKRQVREFEKMLAQIPR